MKVEGPFLRLGFTSQDILPASCTSKPQVPCTSVPKSKMSEGYSNQEIYERLVSIKNHLSSLFGRNGNEPIPLDYLV